MVGICRGHRFPPGHPLESRGREPYDDGMIPKHTNDDGLVKSTETGCADCFGTEAAGLPPNWHRLNADCDLACALRFLREANG
jgi:hypothetical protein